MGLDTECVLFWLVVLEIPAEDIAIGKGSEQVLAIESKMAIAVKTCRTFENLNAAQSRFVPDHADIVRGSTKDPSMRAKSSTENLTSMATDLLFHLLS